MLGRAQERVNSLSAGWCFVRFFVRSLSLSLSPPLSPPLSFSSSFSSSFAYLLRPSPRARGTRPSLALGARSQCHLARHLAIPRPVWTQAPHVQAKPLISSKSNASACRAVCYCCCCCSVLLPSEGAGPRTAPSAHRQRVTGVCEDLCRYGRLAGGRCCGGLVFFFYFFCFFGSSISSSSMSPCGKTPSARTHARTHIRTLSVRGTTAQ
ncbi:uncharacterized protein K452DRAFT_159018 [Aplosporella prunicola CBS 121167]|uniref:Transmembrane protein n=1 Tax=Aplosporella prunicola CBS 121167 TaxID=1176127 RepID=A0A6A6AW25_9PEZI|nr:uncharacterized protein K452DRAFT_159018 [Aplosporella prunicola CBS 121167]KAF2135806.1 hypothetical protein K452DRAFT_159018 [Aplosporella prunicola CBS 121167]